MSLLDDLLRSPERFLARLEEKDLLQHVRLLLLTIWICAGTFGAVVGAYRGGRQILYCAVKVPLLLLICLLICTPPFISIARAAGLRLHARNLIALTLGACARFSLLLAGLAPVMWLIQGWLWYHNVILVVVLCCSLAGVYAGTLLARGLRSPSEGAASGPWGWLSAERVVGAAFVLIFALTGAQTSWLLRPFLVRPRTVEVPFLRSFEGDLVDSVRTSARSAAGIYAPPPAAPACEASP